MRVILVIISNSISIKVWNWARIELSTPGSAVRGVTYCLSSFAIILEGKRELVALRNLSLLVSCDCYCSAALALRGVGWFVVCYCGIF